MGVVSTPSRHTFECDGTQRVFPIPSNIIAQDYVRMEIDGVLISNRREWDVVNNSIVFVTAPLSGSTLDVQVASDVESLGELGMLSNVDILAQNITNVNKVADIDLDVTKVANIDLDVTTVAGIVSEIPIVSAIETDVTTVAGISSDVITVANIDLDVTKVANIDTKVTTVADNILDIQNAEENSIIAKEEAWRAEAERLTAKSYATEPEDVYVKIYTSNNDGTFTVTNTADYSSYHWERKATTLVTTGIIDDVTSYADRTYSSNKIVGIVNAINNNITTIVTDNITPIENSIDIIEGDVSTLNSNVATLNNTTVKLTGTQTIDDVKTFTSSPIVPTPTTDFQVSTKKYVDDAIVEYGGESKTGHYGFRYNQETNVTAKLGSENRTQIQKNMKRCVLNNDGTVKYFLDPYDSTKKEDGTPAVLNGTDGNVMVQVPLFWYKHTLNGNVHEWWVSDKPLAGYSIHPWFLEGGIEHPFRYYRAYTCINKSGVLRSVSGVTPTISQTITTFRTQARANGAGWQLCSWNAVNAIQILYLTEYCNFNSQAMIGHGNHTGDDYGIVTGQSNVIGNESSGSLNNNMWMSYRGIENFYADCWEFVDGINVQNYKVYLNQNPATFASDVFTGDYVDSGITVPSAGNSFVKKISGNFIPTVLGGDSNTFITDAFWSATGNMIALFGSSAYYGVSDGAFCLAVSNTSGHSNGSVGAGLSR